MNLRFLRSNLLSHILGVAGLTALAVNASAAVFLAGSGPSCQYATIQAAINAAAANPGADEVRIANAATWGGTLTLGSQDVTLDGRYINCSDTTPSGNYAQLVGASSSTVALLRITGSGVRVLRGMQIRNHATSSSGAAINFVGTGELNLRDMEIVDNFSGDSGGGIFFQGTAVLYLASNVVINRNQAVNGAGIALSGSSVMYASEPNISIANNVASGSGGGIYVGGSAVAYVGSPGLVSLSSESGAVLQANRATDGGAIAVIPNSAAGARAVLFSTDANRAVTTSLNVASSKGGVAYLNPAVGNARLCILDAYLFGNSAIEGALIYGDVSGAGIADVVYNNTAPSTCDIFNSAQLPLRCLRDGVGCNIVGSNSTKTVGGVVTAGALVLMQTGSRLEMNDVFIGSNIAGHVLRTVDANKVRLETGLIAINTLSGAPLRLNFASGDQGLIFRNFTLAGNSIAASQSVQFEDGPSTLAFNNNIIWQPGKTSVTLPFPIATSPNYNWDFNATNDTTQVLPAPWQSLGRDPRFENPAIFDYRLRVGSGLVDAWPTLASNATRDLDGRTRPVFIPIRQQFVPVDAGAYERQASDPWIVDGSFGATLLYWQPSAGGSTAPGVVWDAQDANASPTSGSALVNLPTANVARLTVLTRCFNVPGAGIYDLRAKIRTNTGISADGGVLRWAKRLNSADCTGPVTTQGDATFASGSAWRNLNPLSIEITSAERTSNTTIELRLDVLEGSAQVGTGLTGVRFDDVAISATLPVTDFADGFE
jgi:hypothetical protein